jgi:hypothetical protein
MVEGITERDEKKRLAVKKVMSAKETEEITKEGKALLGIL